MIYVIAEIGNSHMGDIQNAYSLIQEAKRAGVSAVKFQAGTAKGFARTTDDIAKYEKYVLSPKDFSDLAVYAKSLKLGVIFSIWSPEYLPLRLIEDYHKIPARQCRNSIIKEIDNYNTLVSIPYNRAVREYKNQLIRLREIILNAIPMYCISEYPTVNPELENINLVRDVFNDGRWIGYSDHTIGIEACIEAVKKYKVKVIEKHFTLDKNTEGLRDHKLSADFEDMQKLVKEIGGVK